MKNPRLLALLLVALASSVTAQENGEPHVKSIAMGDGMTYIEFDQPMQTWQGKRGFDQIKISPSIPCQWSWEDDTRLSCELSDEVTKRVASVYQWTIGSGFASQEGGALKPVSLQIVNEPTQLSARIDQWKGRLPVILLAAQKGVSIAAASSVLSIDIDGKPIAYKLKSAKSYRDDIAGFLVEFVNTDIPNGILKLHVRPGLKNQRGPVLGTQSADILKAELKAFQLDGIKCSNQAKPTEAWAPFEKPSAMVCDPGAPIVLLFSQALSKKSFEWLEKQLPVGFSLKPTYDYGGRDWKKPQLPSRSAYAIVSKQADLQYVLPLSKDIVTEFGEALKPVPDLLVQVGDFLPSISIKPRSTLLLPNDRSDQTLLAMNPDEKNLDIEGVSIGTDVKTANQKLALKAERNEATKNNLMQANQLVQENGGLFFAKISTTTPQAYSQLYAPFNVLFSLEKKQVLVWATQWQSGTTIPDAKAELMVLDKQHQLHVLASGRTDAQGVAMLQAAMLKDVDSKGLTLLRVSKNQQTVVIPVSDQGHSDWSKPAQAESTSFGVTELPLYRPGETVKYRLWLREKTGNRLLPPVDRNGVAIVLMDGNNQKNLQRWKVDLDPLGGVSAELPLSNLITDGYYCIRPAEEDDYDTEYSGACFQVARFDAQPLWAELKADKKIILMGEQLKLSMQGGYYSGGPAANIDLRVMSLASAKSIEQVYPEYSEFNFITSDTDDDATSSPFYKLKLPKSTNAKGQASYDFNYAKPLPSEDDDEESIAFGTIDINFEARIPGKASAMSNTTSTFFSEYERYVGLKTQEHWLKLGEDPGIEAIVVDYQGHAVKDTAIKLAIYEVQDKKQLHVADCQLVSGQAGSCSFIPSKAGVYLFKATSKGAANVELTRYAGEYTPPQPKEDTATASLELLTPADSNNLAVVMFKQPYASANVLFTLQYDQIVHYWVQEISSAESTLKIPLKSEWAPGVTLVAQVRPANASSVLAAAKQETLKAAVDLNIPKQVVTGITASADKQAYLPGDMVQLSLHNNSQYVRHATVSVLDDSIYQQAWEIKEFQSPDCKYFLGLLKDWSSATWYGLDHWENRRDAPELKIELPKSTEIQSTNTETAQPVFVLTREQITDTRTNNVYDVLNSIKASEGSGLSTVTTDNFSRNKAAVVYDDDESKSLDRVEVVGSRIKMADVFLVTASDTKHAARSENSSGKPMPRVRSQFQDAIYWNPDITLAPGETKVLNIKLPDNLTRWRGLIWTSDDKDGFAQEQVSFETNLPIEVRTSLPGQLYVGDKASAQITARNQSETARDMELSTAISGSGVEAKDTKQGSVAAYALLTQNLDFAPQQNGSVELLAIAESSAANDGVYSQVNVKSRVGEDAMLQSGWLDQATLDLTLPTLPSSATNARLDLTVSQGFQSWTTGWLQDLHDYPHRCWEQTLSRAIGAAYADQHPQGFTWADRKTVINDAVQAAASFQDEDGKFHYFQTERFSEVRTSYTLSAYSLKGFAYLRKLGISVPDEIYDNLQTNLAAALLEAGKQKDPIPSSGISYETAATIAGALQDSNSLKPEALQVLWSHWDQLSWFARSELLLGMAKRPELADEVRQGITRLQQAGTRKGLRKILGDRRDFSLYMGSGLRDQCAVASTLWQLDHSDTGLDIRKAWLRGVYDLYAGGTASLDTQSSAQCLMAIQAINLQAVTSDAAIQVRAEFDGNTQLLNLNPRQAQASIQTAINGDGKHLRLSSDDQKQGTLNYTATVQYQYDMREAEAKGVGLSLQRHYDILRAGAWVPVEKTSINEGDWIRVRLQLHAPTAKYFVALTDIVPGGFVTRDITLSSVGGAQLNNVGGNGSYYFGSRQTAQDTVKIYAESLPSGEHEVYYYAQAIHAGDYFAPPAIAELMYGRASRANTSADRVTIQATK
ncbi:MAG: alpha-2-macroglobulin family protein [Arenimonas sp.]